jgi:hypothetical protein
MTDRWGFDDFEGLGRIGADVVFKRQTARSAIASDNRPTVI